MNLIKILSYKFSFKKNKKVDILLLDDNYSFLNFKERKVEAVNFYEINFYYLFKTLFTFFIKNKNKINFKKLYWKCLMEDFNPKVALGNDINMRIFSFKDMFPTKKTIVYQLGHYWDIHVDRSRDQLSGKKCDYFFIFSEWEKRIFNVIKTIFIINGSTRNNEKITKKEEQKVYDFMFISEFRKLDKNTINNQKKGYHSYTFANKSIHMSFKDVCSIYALNILNTYCNANKKKICVARSSFRKDKRNKISSSDEMKFFNEYLNNFNTEDIDSYELAEKSNLIICIASNLGPELLARGKKVLFLNLNSLTNDWPFLPNDEGPFWYKGKNIDVINKKIQYLLNLSSEEWGRILEDSKIKMNFDPNNSKLKTLVNEICDA